MNDNSQELPTMALALRVVDTTTAILGPPLDVSQRRVLAKALTNAALVAAVPLPEFIQALAVATDKVTR